MPAIFEIQDVEGNFYTDNSPGDGTDGTINFPSVNVSEEAESTVVTQTITLKGGWNIFSTYLDVNVASGSFASGNSIDDVISSGLSGGAESIIIIKNNVGSAYLPEWDFNGIGSMVNGEGYQMKLTGTYLDTHTLTLTGNPIETEGISGSDGELVQEGTDVNYVYGWNLIGVPINTGPEGLAADVVFADLVDSGSLIIIKDNLGAAFLPEWGFNGIGNLFSGQGYQMKTYEACSMTFSGDYGLGSNDDPH